MIINDNELIAMALAHGAKNAAVIDVAAIPFKRDFRKACEINACGMYGRCWTCPPDVGDIDELILIASAKQYALVYQTIGELEDSYDFEGMQAAGAIHSNIAHSLRDDLIDKLPGLLPLGAGGCHLCDICTKMTNEPCRFPARAMASVESYGIAVSELAQLCGMKYINGENTVTYFCAFLFNRE